jgi:hypothetical protein
LPGRPTDVRSKPFERKCRVDIRTNRADDLIREPQKAERGVGLVVFLAGGGARC